MKNFCLIMFLSLLTSTGGELCAAVRPAAVGWGNLIVPGLGSTFREQPGRGAIEALLEIGIFYGATFGVSEGSFTIDSTVLLQPSARGRRTLLAPTIGLSLQQIGLKAHMFNTFYHYQQATLAQESSITEIEKLQPLYRGTWTDVLAAPFEFKNLTEPWVFGSILLSGAGIFLDYSKTKVARQRYRPTDFEQGLTAFNDIGLIPLGSAFGEEVLFRGMMQREFHHYTGSLWAAILMQSIIFAALHPEENHIPAFLGGVYFGYLTHHYRGDLGAAIAVHFWIDVFSGLMDYFQFRVAHGGSAPYSPGLKFRLEFPLP